MQKKQVTRSLMSETWNYLQRLSLEPMNPFPWLTSNTFNTWVDGFSLLRYKLSPALCHAAIYQHSYPTRLFFFITYTRFHPVTMSGHVWETLKISSQNETTQGVMSWPSGKFQSPRMSQWRWWAIAASRIPCWCPSPSKKNGGNWSRDEGGSTWFWQIFSAKVL